MRLMRSKREFLSRSLILDMPRAALLTLFATLLFAFTSNTFAAGLPQVRLFTTGGTIQSKGAHRQKLMEYSDGKVAPEELLADLPELKQIADVSYSEIANV